MLDDLVQLADRERLSDKSDPLFNIAIRVSKMTTSKEIPIFMMAVKFVHFGDHSGLSVVQVILTQLTLIMRNILICGS